jgi:DNA-binding Xre family transcriptional regulator
MLMIVQDTRMRVLSKRVEMAITRLEAFLKSRDIKPAHLARESGYSRQHLLRLRMGRMEPTRRCIAAVAAACRRLSGEPVRAAELFSLDDDDGHPQQE